MPSNPFASSGRNNVHDSNTSNVPAPKQDVKHKSPLTALKTAGDKLRPHTAVTSTTRKPGHSDEDVKAGTAGPIAFRAKDDARNAGRGEASKDREQGAGQDGSMHNDGAYDFDFDETPSSFGDEVAQNPDKYMNDKSDGEHKSSGKPKHAGKVQTSEAQRERMERVLKHREERLGKENHLTPIRADGSVSGMSVSDSALSTTQSTQETGDSTAVNSSTAGKPEAKDDRAKEAMKEAVDDVPGLAVGDEDPGLPGHDKEAEEEDLKAQKGEDSVAQPHGKEAHKSGFDPEADDISKDVDDEKVEKKLGTKQSELEDKRSRQAEYVGWRQIGGWDLRSNLDSKEAANLLQRSTLLEEYIKDKFFGDWYQNTAIIFITGFFSWAIGYYGFSVSWISIIFLVAGSIYRTSIRRLRLNYRDDIVREVSLTNLEEDKESMEWFNAFFVKFWLIYEPSLSEMITQIANEILKEQTPGFIDSMSLKKFTLGTKAPRMDFIRTFPKTDPDVAVMDIATSFTPNDTLDLTARQLRSKVNPKIQLNVKIGKGPISQSLPVLVEDMMFKGTARLRIKMMPKFPHVQTVDVSFLEPPDFDFVLKPIGGDRFGFDFVKTIPGLSKFIKEMVHANIGPMLYAPNAFQVDVEQMMAGVGIMTGVGVLSVNVRSASGLSTDRRDGSVDPYVALIDQNKNELARSKIKANNKEPIFNETLRTIISNTTGTLLVEVRDFNEQHNDRVVGSLVIPISKAEEGLLQDIQVADVISGGNPAGKLTYSCQYSRVHMPTTDENGEIVKPRDSKSGILGLQVVGARNLDPSISKTGRLSAFCEIEIGGRLVDSTRTAASSNDPDLGYVKELIIQNKSAAQMLFRLRDNRGKTSPLIGTAKFRLPQLLLENQKEHVWFPLQPEGTGEIRIETQWKPVTLSDSSAANYVEPAGVLRLTIKGAHDLRNLEHIGKIDPYARVFLNGSLAARTDWFDNDLNPEWNELHYVPVQDELQELCFEVMDVEKRGKDRSLGSFNVDLREFVKKDPKTQEYQVYISDKEHRGRLIMPGRGPKGTLTYSIEFYPATPIIAPSDRKRVRREVEKIKELEKKEEQSEEDKEEITSLKERVELAGVDMPLEKQLEFKTGVFAFTIDTVTGVHPGQRLRVVTDNRRTESMLSQRAKTSRLGVSQSGDCVTGQLPLSSLRFEVISDHGEGKTNIEKELVVGMQQLLHEAHEEPKTYDIDEDSQITVNVRWFPLPDLIIDDSEDIENTGCLQVKLYRAHGLRVADSGGTSDPYCAFYFNENKDTMYKSEVIKKTLDPVWNENFRLPIENIKETVLKAVVYDWDLGNKDDFLGGVAFDLSELEPLKWKDFSVDLASVKKGRGHRRSSKATEGSIELSVCYNPGTFREEEVPKEVHGVAKVGLTAVGAVGTVGGLPVHGVRSLFGHRGSSESAREDAENWSVSIDQVKGVGEAENVQIRAIHVNELRPREVYRSKDVKVEDGIADFEDAAFEFQTQPGDKVGFKLLVKKTLGHGELGQTELQLSPGRREVDFGGRELLIVEMSKS